MGIRVFKRHVSLDTYHQFVLWRIRQNMEIDYQDKVWDEQFSTVEEWLQNNGIEDYFMVWRSELHKPYQKAKNPTDIGFADIPAWKVYPTKDSPEVMYEEDVEDTSILHKMEYNDLWFVVIIEDEDLQLLFDLTFADQY